ESDTPAGAIHDCWGASESLVAWRELTGFRCLGEPCRCAVIGLFPRGLPRLTGQRAFSGHFSAKNTLRGRLFSNINYSCLGQYPILEKSEAVAGRRLGLFLSWSDFFPIRRRGLIGGERDSPGVPADRRLSGVFWSRGYPGIPLPQRTVGRTKPPNWQPKQSRN